MKKYKRTKKGLKINNKEYITMFKGNVTLFSNGLVVED
jgi:hypothetical protein